MAKSNQLTIYFMILFFFYVSACGTTNSLKPYYDNHFNNIEVVEKNKVTESPFVRHYQNSDKQIWDNTLTILVQYTTVLKVFKESSMIFFVDIDGVFCEREFYYMEFPFFILIEKESEGTAVYIYPMIDLVADNVSKNKLKIMKLAFSQKAEEFLERLTVQLTAKNRWPWLIK